MPEVPAEAVAAALAKRADLLSDRPDPMVLSEETLTRLMLEAAAPILAETTLTPLAKRHAMIPSEWGGALCGTCWNKDGSRSAWPCAELLAVAALLPESAEVPRA